MFFKHIRPFKHFEYSTTGGITLAIERTNSIVAYGIATCSDKDNFCRATGRKVATERLQTSPRLIASADIVEAFGNALPRSIFTEEGIAKVKSNITISDLSNDFIIQYIRSIL